MSRVDYLLMLQKRAFASSPWHGVLSALDGVSEDAFLHVPSRHNGFPWMDGSIRDIVYHIAGDKLVQLDSAFGDGSITWKSLPIEKGEMPTMLIDMKNAHEHAVQQLAGQTDDTLREKVASWGGKRMTAEDLFLMLIEHDIYHAGQIRYIRNVIE